MLRGLCNNPVWGWPPGGSSWEGNPEIPAFPENPENPELSRHPGLRKFRRFRSEKGAPSGPETRFSTLSDQCLGRFSVFFKVASRERCASQREVSNLDFDWQAQYIGAFLHFAKNPTIDNNRRIIAP